MVIVKSSGIATYNFAVVVDDVDMEISHVIRGEDHIHNTAKQILMYEALGAQVPHFAHPALIFDIERRKLSKRFHGEAVHIERYRQLGYLPEAMVNYLAQMSWTHPENKEIFTLEEASRLFDLSKVSKSPAVFDEQRLNWFNSQYIRELSIDEVIRLGKPFLADYDLSKYSDEELKQMVVSVRDGLTCLAELKVALKFFFVDDIEISSEQKENVLAKESAAKVLAAFSKLAPTLPYGIPSECKAKLDALGKELGYKGKDLYWPVRLALSGSVQGPDLGTVLSALKSERIARRLGTALSLCNNLESTTGVK
jgi:nondiscriminating glutamyl-tRNA synthetase